VTALGTLEGLEAELVPRAGIELLAVPRVPLPRKASGAWLRLPGSMRRAVAAAAAAIDASGADAVVGFGGYVSTPAYLAARRRRIPWIVHEANARPGLANRFGARGAAGVAVTFPGTPLPRAELTGLPLRPEIRELAEALADPARREAVRTDARARLGWRADVPTLLVTGGSLGAASLNAATAGAAPALVAHGVHVLHLTGRGKSSEAERVKGGLAAKERELYVIQEYAHDMATAFAAADALVCRAGAATASEVSALGIPAVYVPLPHGNGEQALNARPAVKAGAAVLVADADLTPAALEQQAERLVLDPAARVAAVAAASSIGIRDGAERLVAMIEGAIRP
jgi:UDP-N-acetylmuramate--alanine ligase/UDP-N-acetylglucosamine--N-acetylmuramyl-(pentapeptide) pyrophosphoryl-undecaprenol N-acetylglucosamine transferase